MLLPESFFRIPDKMRRSHHVNFLTGLLFLTLSSNACAEWSELERNGEAVIYVDAATLDRTTDPASVWILKDYRQAQAGPSREQFRSVKIYYEFKCTENRMRQSYLTRFFGAMGGAGSSPSDARFHPWTPVVPGSENATLFRFVCK